MKIKFALPILASALLCLALILTASPAQAAVSVQGADQIQPVSPAAPPPPPGPTPPSPTPPPPAPPAPHPRPSPPPSPTPAEWPYYYGTPWPYYYSSAWPWVGTYRYYYTAPAVVTPAYTVEQYSYAPVVNSFTANPSYIQPGESAVLSWTTSNANNVLISPSVGSVANSGSFTVQPNYTTTYTLTATGSNGTVSASTTVTVAPVITAYTATAATTQPDTTYSQTGDITGLSSGGSSAGTPWLMYLLLIALLAVGAIVIILLVTRKPAAAHAGTKAGFLGSSTAVSGTGLMTTPAAAGHGAKLVGSGGEQVDLGGKLGALGRKDFQSWLKPDKAELISRQHILLDYDSGHYYIEDKQSTNGTRLNGSAIKGTGRHMLKEGDTIELGNSLTVTFKT